MSYTLFLFLAVHNNIAILATKRILYRTDKKNVRQRPTFSRVAFY